MTASVTSMVFTTNTYQTSTVANAGSIALTAQSYSVTVSKPASGAPTFKVFQCAVAWVSTKCSGGAGTQVGGTIAANSLGINLNNGLTLSASGNVNLGTGRLTIKIKIGKPTNAAIIQVAGALRNRLVSPYTASAGIPRT